jgi:hypothetical protein
MSGSKWQAQVPSDLDAQLTEYKHNRGIENDAEAARQLLRKGLKHWKDEQQPTSRAERPLLEVGRVGVVAAAVGLLMAIGLQNPQLVQASLAVLFVGVVGYATVAYMGIRGDR